MTVGDMTRGDLERMDRPEFNGCDPATFPPLHRNGGFPVAQDRWERLISQVYSPAPADRGNHMDSAPAQPAQGRRQRDRVSRVDDLDPRPLAHSLPQRRRHSRSRDDEHAQLRHLKHQRPRDGEIAPVGNDNLRWMPGVTEVAAKAHDLRMPD